MRILFILFLLVPAVELYFLIQVGSVIGALPTILLTVLTAIAGASLMRSQGIATMQKAQQAMLMGQPPQQEVVEGVMIFLGGLMLLIPGLITDFLGFLLLIPPVRQVMARRLLQRAGSYQRGGFKAHSGETFEGEWQQKPQQPISRIEIIEAEWEEIPPKDRSKS